MTKGKIVLVPFPFDDLSGTKVRPAICLCEPIGPHRHVVLAFISSQTAADTLPTDVIFEPSQADFAASGLRVRSTLRLHRLLTVSTSLLRRELGEVAPARQSKIDEKLRQLFGL